VPRNAPGQRGCGSSTTDTTQHNPAKASRGAVFSEVVFSRLRQRFFPAVERGGPAPIKTLTRHTNAMVWATGRACSKSMGFRPDLSWPAEGRNQRFSALDADPCGAVPRIDGLTLQCRAGLLPDQGEAAAPPIEQVHVGRMARGAGGTPGCRRPGTGATSLPPRARRRRVPPAQTRPFAPSGGPLGRLCSRAPQPPARCP
jgi:hypothetical protein